MNVSCKQCKQESCEFCCNELSNTCIETPQKLPMCKFNYNFDHCTVLQGIKHNNQGRLESTLENSNSTNNKSVKDSFVQNSRCKGWETSKTCLAYKARRKNQERVQIAVFQVLGKRWYNDHDSQECNCRECGTNVVLVCVKLLATPLPLNQTNVSALLKEMQNNQIIWQVN